MTGECPTLGIGRLTRAFFGGDFCLRRLKPTSFCCPLAVQNLQDILGNLLDGMAGIISLLPHPKQYDQPLVALMAA